MTTAKEMAAKPKYMHLTKLRYICAFAGTQKYSRPHCPDKSIERERRKQTNLLQQNGLGLLEVLGQHRHFGANQIVTLVAALQSERQERVRKTRRSEFAIRQSNECK